MMACSKSNFDSNEQNLKGKTRIKKKTCLRRGSNPRSLDYESDALPIELKFPYDGLHVKRKIPNGKNISCTASYISHDSVV